MATETTLTSAKAWAPDLNSVPPDVAIPDALILSTSTVAGTVEGDAPAIRCQYVDDASAGFVPEGTVIAEADPALSEVLVYTGKVAQLIRLSREQFSQPNASQLLSTSVARAVTRAANTAYVAQVAPTGPAVTPPAGLLNVSGIVNGGAVASTLDGLVDLLATLSTNLSMPSHILLSPSAWGSLRKFKAGSALNGSLLGAGTTDAQQLLLGLPVIVDPAVPTNTGLVVDKTAVVSAVSPVQVGVSEHVYFNADSVGVRCVFRFGQNVVKPNRIGKFTVTVPT